MRKPIERFSSRPPQAAAMPRLIRLIRLIGGLAIVLIAMYFAWEKSQQQPAPQPAAPVPVNLPDAENKTPPEKKLPQVRVEPERVVKTQIKNAKIRNQDGRVVFEGTVDLRDTLDRIERGERGSHSNDGTVFQNREKRLPTKASGYYREWVHPTPKLRGPGPQRIVTGEDGEIYYTPDHYQSFERLDERQK